MLFKYMSKMSMASLTSLIDAHRLTLDTLVLSNIKLNGQEKVFDGCAGLELPALERLDLACVNSSEINWPVACRILALAGPLKRFFLDIGLLAFDKAFLAALSRNCSASLKNFRFATWQQSHEVWSLIASFIRGLGSLQKLLIHEESGRKQRMFPIFDVPEMINAVVSCAKTLVELEWKAWGRLGTRELRYLTSRLVNVVHLTIDVDYTIISWVG